MKLAEAVLLLTEAGEKGPATQAPHGALAATD